MTRRAIALLVAGVGLVATLPGQAQDARAGAFILNVETAPADEATAANVAARLQKIEGIVRALLGPLTTSVFVVLTPTRSVALGDVERALEPELKLSGRTRFAGDVLLTARLDAPKDPKAARATIGRVIEQAFPGRPSSSA